VADEKLVKGADDLKTQTKEGLKSIRHLGYLRCKRTRGREYESRVSERGEVDCDDG
jgi:hypothetical protein